jgi:hypothetical protein
MRKVMKNFIGLWYYTLIGFAALSQGRLTKLATGFERVGLPLTTKKLSGFLHSSLLLLLCGFCNNPEPAMQL